MKKFKSLTKSIVVVVLAMALTIGVAPAYMTQAQAKTIKTSVTVKKSKTIKTSKKIKSVKTSNKKVATVKKSGSKKFKVTGKKAGTATITVKFTNKKTAKYKITVKKASAKKPAKNDTDKNKDWKNMSRNERIAYWKTQTKTIKVTRTIKGVRQILPVPEGLRVYDYAIGLSDFEVIKVISDSELHGLRLVKVELKSSNQDIIFILEDNAGWICGPGKATLTQEMVLNDNGINEDHPYGKLIIIYDITVVE